MTVIGRLAVLAAAVAVWGCSAESPVAPPVGPSTTAADVLTLRLVVNAVPAQLTTSRSTRIVATVLDAAGKPVANMPVSFAVSGANERMDSAGHPVFTDAHGRAEDVLRTVSPADAAPYAVTLRVRLTRGDEHFEGSVQVAVN